MPEKPKLKRAPTAGTRRGNGSGWGGPAKGAGSRSAKQDFGPDTNAEGLNRTSADTRAERRRQRADALEDHLYELAMNAPEDRDKIAASVRLHAICDGLPVARQVLTGDATAPLGYVIYGVPEKPSVDEWTQAHTPKPP